MEILVEASGSKPAASMMTAMAGVRAEILLLSVYKDPALLDLRTVNFAEQSIIGSRVYTGVNFLDAIDYANRNRDKLQPVISHLEPLERGQAVFQDIISGQSGTMKVLLQVQP